jgi:aspartate/methionine/tyrosine aminotransferase
VKPKSHEFADRVRWNLEENQLNQALIDAKSAGAPFVDLTQSNPTACGFTYDQDGIEAALAHPGISRYEPDPRGMSSARQAVSLYYREQHSPLTADDLTLTSGTSEAYSFLFRLLCNPGDEVLIPSPGYPLFEFLADLCDVKLVRYSLNYDHGWQINFPALSEAATERTRAVIVVHPNNPTGHYTSRTDQAKLSHFCAERGIALIADEVFLDFSLAKTRETSFAIANEALTFTFSGISKICGMPQMKLAWIAVNGPTEQKREALARLEIIADAYLSVGTPVQLAAPALLGMRLSFHHQVMQRLQTNLRELDAQLAHQSVCDRQPACNRLTCEGGWSAVLRVPALQSDEDLAISLLTKAGVYIHPGHFYDFPQPGYAVISLIVPENEFAEGIRRVLAYFG